MYHEFIRSAHLLTGNKRLKISDHNETLFFLHSSFVNIYLKTRIISVGEIFTKL